MKTTLSILFLLLIAFNTSASECQKIDIKHINALKITYSGSPKTIFQYKDKTGIHIFMASTFTQGKFAEVDYKSEVYFYKFTQKNGVYIKQWEAKDFGSSLVDVVFHRFVALDADDDNEVEAFAFYSLNPDGLDADTVKLLINYKNTKYAIRGAFAKEEGDFDVRSTDAMFKQLPKKVREYAYRMWDEIF